jgi:hypothetical protein
MPSAQALELAVTLVSPEIGPVVEKLREVGFVAELQQVCPDITPETWDVAWHFVSASPKIYEAWASTLDKTFTPDELAQLIIVAETPKGRTMLFDALAQSAVLARCDTPDDAAFVTSPLGQKILRSGAEIMTNLMQAGYEVGLSAGFQAAVEGCATLPD